MPEITATLSDNIWGSEVLEHEYRCNDPFCCPPDIMPVAATIEDEASRFERVFQERITEASVLLDRIPANYTITAPTFTLPEETVTPKPTMSARDLNMVYVSPNDPGYGQHLRNSFQFFRRNGNNRYSASTLMRLANAAGEYDDRTRQGTQPSQSTSTLLPVLTVASRPYSYDEETEVKSGGTLGMMVTWPDGKSLFAVVAGGRRQGIGRTLFSYNNSYSSITPFFWVNTTNVPAQQFLLSVGLTVTGLNGNGAVRYGYSGGEE